MQIKLPTVEEVFNEQTEKIETKTGFLPVEIDTSFFAHLKWEEQFQEVIGCDLVTYTVRVAAWLKDENTATAHLIGILKMLYCYINSPALPTFKDFLRLFKPENSKILLEKIASVLEEVNKAVSKN
jgi:hypothetical protein